MSITRTSKSLLFRRAHQIVRVNRSFTFSAALKLAWSELKEFDGAIPYFWHFDAVSQKKSDIAVLEAAEHLGAAGRRKLVAAYDELSAIQQAA
jgi:hypothetical protein